MLIRGRNRAVRAASIVAATSYQYWRVLFTQEDDFTGGSLAELEFIDTPAGADLTEPLKTVSDFSSAGSSAFGGDRVNLYNEITTDFWAGASGSIAGGTSWHVYDFEEPTLIKGVLLQARSGTNGPQCPVGWNLQISDDNSTWTTILTETGGSQYSVSEEREFIGTNTTLARYVRLFFTEAGSFNGGALTRIKFLNALGGDDLVLTSLDAPRTIGGSEFSSSFPIENAFDDTISTEWAGEDSAIANGTSWLGYRFIGDTTISGVRITARDGSDSTQTPLGFVVQGSDDGLS